MSEEQPLRSCHPADNLPSGYKPSDRLKQLYGKGEAFTRVFVLVIFEELDRLHAENEALRKRLDR